jgi:hypothetical protein
LGDGLTLKVCILPISLPNTSLGLRLQAFDKHEYLKGVPIPDFARHQNNLKKKEFLPKKKIGVMYALHKQLDK